jgi:molybdate transport system substrate-binding protein
VRGIGVRGIVVLGIMALLVAACGGDDGESGSDDGESGSDDRALTVFAASSLTDAFEDLRDRFEADHPGAAVKLQFGASSALARQLADGAEADVVATADERTMDAIEAADDADGAVRFALNRLVLAVERGNPKEIRGVADLGRDDVVFVACAVEVPCGALAVQALDRVHVTRDPASLEENVRAVLAKVTLGEADAGLVYLTDVQQREDVEAIVLGVVVPDAAYYIARTTQARAGRAADDWIDLVRSADGQRVLRSYGFHST